MNKILFSVMCALLLALVGSATLRAGVWQAHPAFDNAPQRVIDTPNRVYFLVHQRAFNRNLQEDYRMSLLTLFQYDKSEPQRGITPLQMDFDLRKEELIYADYSAAGRYLLMVFGNGCLATVGDDGSVRVADGLARSLTSGMSHVRSVVMDADSPGAWVATDGGWARFDGVNCRVERETVVRGGEPIEAVCDVADRFVMLRAGGLYTCASADAESLGALRLEPGLAQVVAIRELSARALLALRTEGSTLIMERLEWVGSGLERTELGRDNISPLGPEKVIMNAWERNLLPTNQGYMLFGTKTLWHVTDQGARSMGHGETSPAVMGSWDFENFWVYRDRGHFQCCAAQPAWHGVSEPVRPSAPLAGVSTNMKYVPGYGMMLGGTNFSWIFPTIDRISPIQFTVQTASGWDIYSPVYNEPRSARENAANHATWLARRSYYPVSDPHGITVDPLNPNVVCFGSVFSGMGMMNLADKDADIAHIASEQDPFGYLPEFHKLVLNQGWGSFCCFSNIEADAAGNLWASFMDLNPEQTGGYEHALWYLPASGRKGVFGISDYNKWVRRNVKNYLPSHSRLNLLVTKHPQNGNRILSTYAMNPPTLLIYDYQQTLEDESDDVYTYVTSFRDQSGVVIKSDYGLWMAENPATGDVVLATGMGALVFNPTDQVVNGEMPCRILSMGEAGSGTLTMAQCAEFDGAGSLWIGTNCGGLLRFDAKDYQLRERYTTENSPLLSNLIYGLGINPVRGSVMVSTRRGLIEYTPGDMTAESESMRRPKVVPEVVCPDFGGDIFIGDVERGALVEILDAEGRAVFKSVATEAGVSWKAVDAQGRRVAPGRYRVRCGGDSLRETEIVIY